MASARVRAPFRLVWPELSTDFGIIALQRICIPAIRESGKELQIELLVSREKLRVRGAQAAFAFVNRGVQLKLVRNDCDWKFQLE